MTDLNSAPVNPRLTDLEELQKQVERRSNSDLSSLVTYIESNDLRARYQDTLVWADYLGAVVSELIKRKILVG
jgi:hypothetical protein